MNYLKKNIGNFIAISLFAFYFCFFFVFIIKDISPLKEDILHSTNNDIKIEENKSKNRNKNKKKIKN